MQSVAFFKKTSYIRLSKEGDYQSNLCINCQTISCFMKRKCFTSTAFAEFLQNSAISFLHFTLCVIQQLIVFTNKAVYFLLTVMQPNALASKIHLSFPLLTFSFDHITKPLNESFMKKESMLVMIKSP